MPSILYSDNHLLVAEKPAEWTTQPEGSADNLTDWAKAWVKQKYAKPGKVFLEPIHRLDKPVSGLLLFARTSKALSRLQEMMRNREIHKTYYAFVSPIPHAPEAVLEHTLVHEEHRARVVSSTHPEGKRARLSYRILRQTKGKALLEIDLETGRYHQIRVQLAAIGCPVVGDAKYGSCCSWRGPGIALVHGQLRLTHPVTKEALHVTALEDPRAYFSGI